MHSRTTSHSRGERPFGRNAARSEVAWAARVQEGTVAGAMALVVCAVLLPSESAISEGTYAPLAALACVLSLTWLAAAWLGRRDVIVIGWTEIAAAALVGWHSLAAIMALGTVNGRQALNALWLFVGYGLTAFLFRQGLRQAEQVRASLVVMVWLAALVASLGLYQYFYSMPRLRKMYEANPEQVLAENGYPTDKSSPQRTLFENRLRSVEPLATFALTNSLAGFLAPWLIGTLAIGLSAARVGGQRSALIAAGALGLLLVGCFILTKSRTAYLAVIVGLIIYGIYGRAGKRAWWQDWRIPAAGAVILAALAFAAVSFGGLDVQVMSEAPKSVLYRLEYWQSTAALIAANPILGCGPGNFQTAYAAFKLPQASETIGDPHNFLFEIWAATGTPGVVLLALLIAGFVADLVALSARRIQPGAAGSTAGFALSSRAIFVGALAGLVTAMPLAILLSYPLEGVSAALPFLPIAWLIGLPLLGAAWRMFDPWVTRGSWSLAASLAALVVLAVNLLAAGALVFPGVMVSALVLVPVALCAVRLFPEEAEVLQAAKSAEPAAGPTPSLGALPKEIQLSSPVGGLATLAAACLAVACLRTEYHPILNGQLGMRRAFDSLRAGDDKAAEAMALSAAAADPRWPEPWRLVADVRLNRWLGTDSEADWNRFAQAADELARLDPRNHGTHYLRGNWYLTAWRKKGRATDLSEAVNAYGRASVFYPNRALFHAQLAWVMHLAGEEALASDEAEEARLLDDHMPHREQKLSQQRVFDPQLAARQGGGPTAEQTVEQLRTTGKEKSL